MGYAYPYPAYAYPYAAYAAYAALRSSGLDCFGGDGVASFSKEGDLVASFSKEGGFVFRLVVFWFGLFWFGLCAYFEAA